MGIVDDNGCPFLCKLKRNATTNAAIAASNNCYLLIELSHHEYPFFSQKRAYFSQYSGKLKEV
jgi:hypothetical protein